MIKMVAGRPVEVDEDIYKKFENCHWSIKNNKYVFVQIGRKKYNLARLIMNAPDHLQVDHIDRNPLNNKRQNLRLVTNMENSWNKGKRSDAATSKYKGVTKQIVRQKGKEYVYWRVELYVNYKRVICRTFKDEIEAAKMYDKVAKHYFGEFAVLNFPESTVQPSTFNV